MRRLSLAISTFTVGGAVGAGVPLVLSSDLITYPRTGARRIDRGPSLRFHLGRRIVGLSPDPPWLFASWCDDPHRSSAPTRWDAANIQDTPSGHPQMDLHCMRSSRESLRRALGAGRSVGEQSYQRLTQHRLEAVMTDLSLEHRIDRLDSIEQIRQLAAKYALAVDMSDLNALVELYVDDVRVGRDTVGRTSLKEHFANVLSQFDATAHFIGNHIIEFDDTNHAQGTVYCYAHHEMGKHWIVAHAMYHDSYERRQGLWLFSRRTPLLFYATEWGEAPTGANKVRWPGKQPAPGNMHEYSPAWKAFHLRLPETHNAATGNFLKDIRRGQPLPRSQIP